MAASSPRRQREGIWGSSHVRKINPFPGKLTNNMQSVTQSCDSHVDVAFKQNWAKEIGCNNVITRHWTKHINNTHTLPWQRLTLLIWLVDTRQGHFFSMPADMWLVPSARLLEKTQRIPSWKVSLLSIGMRLSIWERVRHCLNHLGESKLYFCAPRWVVQDASCMIRTLSTVLFWLPLIVFCCASLCFYPIWMLYLFFFFEQWCNVCVCVFSPSNLKSFNMCYLCAISVPFR